MQPVSVRFCQCGCSLGSDQSSLAVPPLGVGGNISPVSELGPARVQPILVLSVNCNDASGACENVLEVLLLVHQQVPCAAAHEHLDATDSSCG